MQALQDPRVSMSKRREILKSDAGLRLINAMIPEIFKHFNFQSDHEE